MGIPTPSLNRMWLSIVVVAITGPGASADNAVAGTVRDASAKDLPPLGGVQVAVQQEARCKDKSREEDGAYALDVPNTHAKIDIMFSKDGFTTAFDVDVDNSKSPNKRPVVYMAAKGKLKDIPEKQLDAILANTLKAASRAKALKLPAVTDAVKENLKLFKAELGDSSPAGKVLVKIEEVIRDR